MISVENLCKSYGSQDVLCGVTCKVRKGTITAVIGRSGAGKSVLLKHMAGLETPDKGSVIIDGENIVGMKIKDVNRIRQRFGVLFQDGALFDSLTVKENVAFPVREHRRLTEKETTELVNDRLAKVGMKDHAHKYPSQLSGGMRKRVGLARALALDPDVVFFDEPTTGLDPITEASIYRLIERTHSEKAITYLLVSHDIGGILRIADEVLMLLGGRIVAQGSPEEIRQSEDPAVRQFITGSSDGPLQAD
jgi:phospholipid/cholesterol/gamma-HCH transport system ATP-binding protein